MKKLTPARKLNKCFPIRWRQTRILGVSNRTHAEPPRLFVDLDGGRTRDLRKFAGRKSAQDRPFAIAGPEP